MQPKRILITGASGFIGGHVVQEALSRGWEVHAGVRASSDRSRLTKLGVRLFPFDMSAPDELRAALRKAQNDFGGFEYIVHGAGITKVRQRGDFERGNALFTRDFGQMVVDEISGIERFIFISSIAALGPGDPDSFQPIREDQEPRPITPYGESKLKGEQYLRDIGNLPALSIRPPAVYGPRDKKFIERVVRMFQMGIDLRLGSPDQRQGFIHVNDLARVIIDACEKPVSTPALNVSDGKAYPQNVLNETIKEELDVKAMKIRIPAGLLVAIGYGIYTITAPFGKQVHLTQFKMRELTAKNWVIDITRAREELGFSPEYDLVRGIRQTLNG